jgi:hypothetical protein
VKDGNDVYDPSSNSCFEISHSSFPDLDTPRHNQNKHDTANGNIIVLFGLVNIAINVKFWLICLFRNICDIVLLQLTSAY